MIAFLGGDPDRPFIAGVVPNAHRPSVVGERNNSQNIIRTGSGNQLVFEDEQGKEFIFLYTPNNRTGIYMGYPSGDHASVYTGEGETKVGTFSSPATANPAYHDVVIKRDIEFSYLKTTAGNGGSWIGGDSWENVGADKFVFVTGELWVGVGKLYTLEIGGAAEETYYAERITTIKAGRVDTVEAGGMTQRITGGMTHDIHGGLTQTIEPEGSQTVTGPWVHRVTAENHDDYGSWKTDVGQTWNGHFCGDVALTSDTNFNIKAPNATITATNLKWEVLGLTFDITPNKHELFTYKGASGVVKTDHAAIYQTAYGLKLDFMLVNLRNTPLYSETYGTAMKQLGAYIKYQAICTVAGAMLAHSVAITKL